MRRFSKLAAAISAVALFGVMTQAGAQTATNQGGSSATPEPTKNTASGAPEEATDEGRVEVVNNGNGTKTARVRLTPKSFRAKDGSKSDVDVSLVDGPRLSAKGVAEPVSLAKSSADKELVSVGTNGRRVVFGTPNYSGLPDKKPASDQKAASRGVRQGEGQAREARKVISTRRNGSNNVVVFDGVFGDGSSLAYEVVPQGVKESIVLTAAPTGTDAPIFRFPIVAEGLTNRASKDGGFEFVDTKGNIAFVVPPAFAFDSRNGVNTPGNMYVAVKQEMRSDVDGLTIVVSPSLKWLQDPTTVYPVTIDPTLVTQTWNAMSLGFQPWGDNSGGAFQQTGTSTSWYTRPEDNRMQFGNWFGSQWKSYTQFDPTLFAGKTITKATLNLFVSGCGASAGNPYANPIYVRQLTSPYWFGQTWPGPTASTALQVLPAENRHSVVDITTIAQAWQTSSANFGLGFDLGGVSNSYCNALRTDPTGQFSSIEYTYTDNAPFINNGSFEAGKAGWGPCYNPNTINYDTPSGVAAFDGQRIMRFNSTVGNGSMCQYRPWRPRAGDYYQVAVKVRSASGAPVKGSATLWEVRAPAYGQSWETHVDFTATATWQEFRTNACARNAEAYELKMEIYALTANQNLDVDLVQLSIGNPSICGGLPATTTTTAAPPTTAVPTTIPVTTTPPPAIPKSILGSGEVLGAGQQLRSPNGQFFVTQAASGALTVTGPGILWTAPGSQIAGAITVMQTDGNLVQYAANTVPWNSGTCCYPGYGIYAQIQDDGNFVVYKTNGVALWSSKFGLVPTNPPPPPPPVVVVQPNPFLTGSVSLTNEYFNKCILATQFDFPVTMGACSDGAAGATFVAESGGYRIKMAGGCLSVDYTHRDFAQLPNGANAAAIWIQPCTPLSPQQIWATNVIDSGNNWFRIEPKTVVQWVSTPCLNASSNPSSFYAVIEYECQGQAPQELWHPTTIGTNPLPVGAHFLEDGKATILELSDTPNLDCATLNFLDKLVLTTDKTKCVVVTPFRLNGGGFELAIGDVDFPADTDCLIRDGNNGLIVGSCNLATAYYVTDTPGENATALSFPIRGNDQNNNGPCLTRSGSSLLFTNCSNPVTANQLWYDKSKAPRTDPCANSATPLNISSPRRTDLAKFQYNTGPIGASDVSFWYTFQNIADVWGEPGIQHLSLAGKNLHKYLRAEGGLYTLSRGEMGRVMARDWNKPRGIAPLILLDVLKASANVPNGGQFGTISPPSVSAIQGVRDGMSKSGDPSDAEASMVPAPGWFRIVSADNAQPDYTAALTGPGKDIYFGLGSFDLRIQGVMVNGFRCFNIFLQDRYMFDASGKYAYSSYVDRDLAQLHKVGMARNFDIVGTWSEGCFIKPSDLTRIFCPGHSNLE
jgi:hypothetical protein